ncbi:alkaline phosphatase family protein [Tautonia plasticadhaerens]|uniref:Type I phosphodiesterase / nucleotide pyrophosphatase n=1 Tax=Tautonia plasticadhaerens TaxID=2527974 RepID=A0A518GYV5_9BACT|nr:alkaline phosphatase family protein [Tautonia plasticadhaerens]QDV33765.1 Type I phosphodiesterase / nucleotide pyrophosphatase [Tautonia plasticadhaerens]
MPGPAPRVVFLGLDGATEAVLRPAFERGWMPNLEALWDRSATGTLWSSEPMVTPVAWTSFLTGCNPPTHGIHEFHAIDPAARTIIPNHAGRIRVPTLWDAISESGREVVSLGLPMTYPPPDVRGIVVAGSDAPGLQWAFAQCPEFGEEIFRDLPGYSHKVLWKRRPRTLDELRSVSLRNREVFRAQAGAAERADARCDWSAMMVHFHNLDGIQHRLWPYLDLDETAAHQPEWTAEVVACLRELDEAVGRLLELASRRDAAVIALSDHGFGPCRALVDVNGLLCRAGLQRRLPYGTRLSYRLSRIRDRFDRWKRRRSPEGTSRRGPRSIEGEVGCDWSRTAAFAPFGQLCGSIFLNEDLVSGSSAAGRTIGEIIDALRAAEDPDTGLPLFADAFDVAERYNLDPAAEGLPDVLAPSTDGYQAMAKWAPFSRSLLRPDPNLPATHRYDGVIAIDAPGVSPDTRLDAELPDVAPTALALLGQAVPEFMEGRILDEAFDRDEASIGTAATGGPGIRPARRPIG